MAGIICIGLCFGRNDVSWILRYFNRNRTNVGIGRGHGYVQTPLKTVHRVYAR